MTDNVKSAMELSRDKFIIVGCKDLDAEKINRPSITYWQDVWRRFKANKVAIGAAALLLIICLLAIFGPSLSGYEYEVIDTQSRNISPNNVHWFGTDEMGRDMFARVFIGGRVSIVVGIVCTAVMITIGVLVGGIAGYFGGVVDDILMRFVEIVGSIPRLIFVILIQIILGRGMIQLVFALTISAWGGTARLVRGQILQLKEMEFVLAEHSLGASPFRIIWKHFIPNVLGIIIVRITLAVPMFIFEEAFLSFVGLGIQPPETSWGALAATAQGNLMFYPYQLFFPCLLISLTMLSFNLMGDGLNDALDPKLRQ